MEQRRARRARETTVAGRARPGAEREAAHGDSVLNSVTFLTLDVRVGLRGTRVRRFFSLTFRTVYLPLGAHDGPCLSVAFCVAFCAPCVKEDIMCNWFHHAWNVSDDPCILAVVKFLIISLRCFSSFEKRHINVENWGFLMSEVSGPSGCWAL